MRLLALLLLLTSGCASIISGSEEDIKVDSDPAGARVLIDGVAYNCPCVVSCSRESEHEVQFPNGQRVKIERKFNAWTLANYPMFGIVGGTVGTAVDAGTGGMMGNLEPDHLRWAEGRIEDAENGKVYEGGAWVRQEAKEDD